MDHATKCKRSEVGKSLFPIFPNLCMEWSFFILCTGAEDFRQGQETFFYHLVGVENIQESFYGVQNVFEVMNQHLK